MSLAVSFTKTERGNEIVVRDDGLGIDPVKVMKRAIELGIAAPEEMQNVSVPSCIKYLMHPKFSSTEEANLVSGRGVGLTLVRRILAERKGRISVKSQTGRFCQFHILLP